jgi:hypothetical protein
VQLEPDATDAFLIAGQRSARVPTLLPGTDSTARVVLDSHRVRIRTGAEDPMS